MLRGCLHGGRKIPLWNNFTLGLHEEISVRIVPKDRRFENDWGIENGGRQKKHTIWALLLSLLALTTNFQQNYHNNQLVVTPNEMVGLYCRNRWLATERPAAIFMWFVHSTRIFLAKAVYMVLGSYSYLSAKKILALGTNTTYPFNMNRMQKTYGAGWSAF